MYVTGGATDSPGIMRRVTAIWNREVIPIEKGGPALGAAVAGIYAYCKSRNEPFCLEDYCRSVLRRSMPISPLPEDVKAYHFPGKFLEQFNVEEAKIIAQHPISQAPAKGEV